MTTPQLIVLLTLWVACAAGLQGVEDGMELKHTITR